MKSPKTMHRAMPVRRAFALGLILTAAGCVGDPDAPAFLVSWNLQYTDGVPARCGEVGTPTVSLLADNVVTGAQYTLDLPCGRGTGHSDVLPAGTYDLTLQLINADGGVVAQRPTETLAINATALTVIPQYTFQIQRFAFFLDWSVSIIGDPDVTTCSAIGASTVAVVLAAGGGAAPTEFRFPCENLGALTPPVAAGVYGVSVFLLDANGLALSETVVGNRAAVATGPSDIGFIEFVVQSMVARWSIERTGQPGAPLGCAQVGANTVELTATLAGQAPMVFSFPCADAVGTTVAVPVGAYTISARLLDGQGNPLSVAPPIAVQIPAETRATLPAIVFEVN